MEVWALFLEDVDGVHLLGARPKFKNIRQELWTTKKDWYKMGPGAWEFNPAELDGSCYVAYKVDLLDSFAESIQVSWDDLDD